MPPLDDARTSALCDFRLQAESDTRGGGLHALRDYIARFPGFEVDVAREYLAILDERADRTAVVGGGPVARYARIAEIGRGGMGIVERVRDTQLDRDLALKLLRRDGPRARRRFQEEARITSLLDHPGVVPVHESGVDPDGTPYFTMRLVEGIDFEEVIARVHSGDREWTMPRALEALVKVCDTMAFAHARGVVHRDLKPSNVRVGRYGEVYVMDWGLAREMSAEDLHEIRPRSADVDVVRGDELEDGLAVVTLEGDVLGTPAYMPPEQAAGEIGAVGPRSDVYSAGAMLHHLMVGRRPYSENSDARRSRDVLELVRAGPPRDISSLRPNAPRELVAICTKAMQRSAGDRYADMRGFADDLRAFLDRRVVSAYRSGPFARVQKWVARNRVLVSVLGVAFVGGVVSLALIALQKLETRQRLIQLYGSQLKFDFDRLWPPHPDSVPVLERWIDDASGYLASRETNSALLGQMEGRALPMNPDRPAERAAAAKKAEAIRQKKDLIAWFRDIDENYDSGKRGPEGKDRQWVHAQVVGNTVALEAFVAEPIAHLTFEFLDRDEQRLYDAIRRVLAEQTEFDTTTTRAGLMGLAQWGLAASRRVEQDSLIAPADRWAHAIRSIADVDECPAYKGLRLTPQLGLVPLGRDPDSGLWEFWHVLSGTEPDRDDRGAVRPSVSMGLVLVLIPSGTVVRGSQSENPEGSNYDPHADANAPWQESIPLVPFFLSKFEVTQAQWTSIAGTNPSLSQVPEGADARLHPIETLDFHEAQRVLRVAGLMLPTEAQWEYAARAGTHTPWFTGTELASIVGAGNVADRTYALSQYSRPSRAAEAPDLDDGWAGSAPIGSYRKNAFGLYDTLGNVREWCADRGPFGYEASMTNISTGERIYASDGTQATRGGSFLLPPSSARSAAREQSAEGQRAQDLGIRPSRRIEE